jgi:hypothetical protein
MSLRSLRLAAALVSVFLCAAYPGAATAQYLVEGLEGPVTPAEIDAFKKEMKANLATTDPLGPFRVYVGNRRNNYVYGLTADAVEGLLAMYEVTKDQEFMDQLVWFADQMLLHRNDRFRKWTIFTGKVEACWSNCPEDTPVCQWYCGTEVGDVVGHIAAVARLILKNRSLWAKPVPGKDPLGLGATFLERARGYLRECRVTLDTFLTPHFVDPPTRRFIWPRHPNYGDGSEKSIRARGKTVPWNQNTMLASGYQNVAEALELLGEEPKVVAEYDAIVKAFADGFFEKITKYSTMGHDVYNWSYASDDMGPDYRYDEDLGHGGYDFWGIYKAYQRGRAGITRDAMIPFVNTTRYVIIRPDGMATANRVNGAGPDRAGLGSTWIYGAALQPESYEVIAGTMVSGAKRDPMTAGRLLWAKHMNDRKWAADPGSDGGVAPPPAPEGSRLDASPDAPAAVNPPGADAGPSGGASGSGRNDAGSAGGSGAGTGGAGGADGETPEGQPPRPPAKSGGCAVGAAPAGGAATLFMLVGLVLALTRKHLP